MSKFPPEILSHIFSEAVPGEDSDCHFLQECIKIPLRISQVCRVWRDVAVSDGRLWSYLFINVNTLRLYKHAKVLFDIWLERSNGAALDYSLDFMFQKHHANQGIVEVAMDMIKTLVAQQHRWRSIEILWSPPREYVGNALELYLTNMPKLTSLDLEIAQPMCFSIDFSKSLQLRVVRLSGDIELESCDETLPLLRSPSTLTFQRGSLTFKRACLRNGAICSYLNFMEAAPFLEELHIIFDGYVELSYPVLRSKHENPVLVPGLRRLSITHNYNPIFIRHQHLFLDYVTLPSLDALQFSSEFRDDALVNFVKRSLPPLTYLAIDCVDVREDAVIESLRLLPTLTEFRYLCQFVSARFLRELTVADHTNLICPALETLYLRRIKTLGYEPLCTGALISMLESRAQISESFQTIKFIEGESHNEYDVSALRDAFERHLLIRADGISVSPSAETPRYPFANI
ncbi:hypothetical protein A7U60_g1512 [Sanghuangporus baumii]|uniref:F-box domain-containing protein n=1 Tax=Sanghuangporus baumii TaxID=108892 RepID=A0A9Q5I3W2_SANBA|nr:hypothetical protein A7U60_g1512 [Sanghuangporus baumii]